MLDRPCTISLENIAAMKMSLIPGILEQTLYIANVQLSEVENLVLGPRLHK